MPEANANVHVVSVKLERSNDSEVSQILDTIPEVYVLDEVDGSLVICTSSSIDFDKHDADVEDEECDEADPTKKKKRSGKRSVTVAKNLLGISNQVSKKKVDLGK